MQMELDFIRDVREGLADELVKIGYQPAALTGDAYKDAHRVCVDHWNAFARRIPQRPRAVHWSGALRARGSALPEELQAGLTTVEEQFQRGDDLTPRLSRRLTSRTFNDKMLNDWGIHHLHLGAAIEGDGFAERTDDVLLVMVRPDDAFLIDVRPHGAWADDDLVEIIHVNWPDAIARYRFDNVTGNALTREERRNLRSKNANAAVQTSDGTVYAGLGGGLVATGANIRAVRWGDYMLMTAKAIQDVASSMDPDSVADEVLAVTGVRPERLVLRLGEIARTYALVFVENAATPFAIKINIERSEPVTIEVR